MQTNLTNSMNGNALMEYFDTSIPYNVTITSNDGVRSVKLTEYVYMIEEVMENEPFNETEIVNCSIQMYGIGSTTQIISTMVSQWNVFYVDCLQDNMTSYLISPSFFITTWSVPGLTPFYDYFNQSGQLFIKPYALGNLNGTTLTVNVTITPVNSTGTNITLTSGMRLLQDTSGSTSTSSADNSTTSSTTTTDPNAPTDSSTTTTTDPNSTGDNSTDGTASTD